ncbi:MAG: hypothetical protein RIT45_4291 [Pseudomonadota bacterium]|jgi:hypothetical protein
MPAPRTLARALTAAALAAALPACSLDGLLLTELTRKGHARMPDPAPVHLDGSAPTLTGATLRLYVGAAEVADGKVGADGRFRVSTDGISTLAGAVLAGGVAGRGALAVVPELPAQASVLDPERVIDLALISPGALELGDASTTLALLVLARARLEGRSLGSISPGSLVETLIDLDTRIRAGEAALVAVGNAVARVTAAATPAAGLPFRPFADDAHQLDDAFAAATGVDADGDGQPDGSGAPMQALLDAAAGSFQFKACYVPDQIRVVLQVRLSKNALNGNCETLNPFLWADDKAKSTMFVTGGVHKDTPRCGEGRTTACLSEAQIDALNQQLGNWVPNKVRMSDDGTGGDAKAGDGIWTYAFVAPWWDRATAPDGAGVRLAYKFTWGSEGQGWTGSEEFPGNQRILELNDVNGDRVIVRFDHFADEATNKDKANGNFEGCGVVKWPATATEGCSTDSIERPVDLDGDCQVDGWPSPGTAAPLTIDCE